MFRAWSLVPEACWALHTILHLCKFMSFQVAVLFSMIFLNLDVTQSSYRRVLSFPVHNILDQIVEHHRCVWRLQNLYHQSGYEKYLCLFLVQCIWFFRLPWHANVNSFAESRLRLSRGFPIEQHFTCKCDNLVQCLPTNCHTKPWRYCNIFHEIQKIVFWARRRLKK